MRFEVEERAAGELGLWLREGEGLAGDCLRKVSNYRRRLAILGDFSAVGSRALRDFIRESNGTGQVVFAAELEAAAALLR